MNFKLIACLVLCTLHPAVEAAGVTTADQSSRASSARLEVEYADTLLGNMALYAVRACLTEDLPTRDDASLSRQSFAGAVHETLTQTNDDIVVRVFDQRGSEISQHVGAKDVCGYARLASAFLTSINSKPQGNE